MFLLLSQAVDGFILDMNARRLSKNTIADYCNTFDKFAEHLHIDKPIAEISHHDVRDFLNQFDDLSPKTVANYHAALSALWSFLIREELTTDHIVRRVPRPRFQKKEIAPFSERDLKLLLSSLSQSKRYRRVKDVYATKHTIPNQVRNRTIILMLLDTGMRVSELLDLQIKDVDLHNRELIIRKGKGGKGRVVPFSADTSKQIWKYLNGKERVQRGKLDHLITSSKTGGQMGRSGVLQLLRRIGERAGVEPCYPHRFRHTFAIMYLRNGGDIFTLQKILGHADLSMVRRYLSVAQTDVKLAHTTASPVANLIY